MRLSRSGQLIAVFSAVLLATLAPQLPRLVADLRGPVVPRRAAGVGLAGHRGVWRPGCCSSRSCRCWACRPASWHGSPRRCCAASLLAGAAGALVAGPAQAEQATGPESRHLPHSVHGLPLPDRPEAHVSPVRAAAPQTIRVRPGDTLWAIAARSLPDGATDAQIAAATTAWHHANRTVIGADPRPDLPPATPHSADREGPPMKTATALIAPPVHVRFTGSGRDLTGADPAALPGPDADPPGAGGARRRPARSASAPPGSCRRSSRCCRVSVRCASWPRGWRRTSTRSSRPGWPSTPGSPCGPGRDAARASCRCMSPWSTTRPPRSPDAWCTAAGPAPSRCASSCRPPTAAHKVWRCTALTWA